MKTATINIIGERVGNTWVGAGQVIVIGSQLGFAVNGEPVGLVVVGMADNGVIVRKKTQEDYDRERERLERAFVRA